MLGFSYAELIEIAPKDKSYRSTIRDRLKDFFIGKHIDWISIHSDLSELEDFKIEKDVWNTNLVSNYSDKDTPGGGDQYHMAILLWFHLEAHKSYDTEKLNVIGNEICVEIFKKTALDKINELRESKKLISQSTSRENDKIKPPTEEENTVGSASSDKSRWLLEEGELSSIDASYCTMNLSLTQHGSHDAPVGAIAEVHLQHLSTVCDISYAFKLVTMKLEFPSIKDGRYAYCQDLREGTVLRNGCEVKLIASGKDTVLQFEAVRTLCGAYVLDSSEFFSVSPSVDQYSFDVELRIQSKHLSIVNVDGKPLEDRNKEIVIACLIAANIGPKVDGDWIAIAKRNYSMVPG